MDDLQNINVFVDECGTNELDSNKQSVSHLFICVAVLAEDESLDLLSESICQVRKSFFSGSELKSSKVGTNFKRRLKILKALEGLPFRFYALIINKDKVPPDSPLQYKRTFYKFINRMLYQNLVAKGACCLNVKTDRIGTKEFMDSFVPYFEKKGMPDLLSRWNHIFVDSKDEPLVQVADFIAGSLSYCYDKSKKSIKSEEINDVLYPHCSGIDVWPYGRIEVPNTLPLDDEDVNRRLQAFFNNKIVDFITKNENSDDEDKQMQAFVLRELYIAREYEDNAKRSIFSDELIKRLCHSGYRELNKQNFTARIIGKLRFDGIILCGSPLGYRVALSLDDINDYIEHDKNIIEPMLWRLQVARNNVRLITPDNHDILALDKFNNLRLFVDIFSSNKNSLETMANITDEES